MFRPISISDINPSNQTTKKVLATMRWELSLFYQLTNEEDEQNGQIILINDLIHNYNRIMKAYNLVPIEEELLTHQLRQIKLQSNMNLVDNGISYYAFCRSLSWMTSINEHYNDHKNVSIKHSSGFNWYRNNVLIITGIVDIIIVSLIVIPNTNITGWLILARISAVIILSNLFWILASLISISDIIPETILIKGYPVEHSTFYHKVFGVKILIASVCHTIGHVLQINHILRKCVNGCTRAAVHIVPYSNKQIIISYSYFASTYPYYTGIILFMICFIMCFSFLLIRMHVLRFSTNNVVHKYCGILVMIFVIAHGCQGLLGFNFSFIFVLPLFLIYLWNHRHELCPYSIRINRWVVTPFMIKLYLQESKRFNDILDKFENASITVKYPMISRFEWHTFTLSRNYESKDLILSMKRVGKWTNELAKVLENNINSYDYLELGYCAHSNFRFHRHYDVRYFFCAGIGITAFMASISDMIRNPIHKRINTKLVWSVNSINMINDFSGQIMRMQQKIPNIKVLIYFSNRSSSVGFIDHNSRVKFAYLQSLIYSNYKIDIVTGKETPICCRFGRADFIDILSKEVECISHHNLSNIGIFICGSKSYANHALHCIDSVNKSQNMIKFKAWTEIAN